MNWTGSGDPGNAPGAESGSAGGSGGSGIELVAVADPAEGAFTIHLPKGWQNQAYSVRPYGVHRAVITSVSPDGGTTLFVGDPQMPDFTEPNPQMFGFPIINPVSQVQPYVPAEPFFRHYLWQRFGGAPGFRVTAAAPCPVVAQKIEADAARYGMSARATAARVSFAFSDPGSGASVLGRLHGATISFGQNWVATLAGLTTMGGGDPARWDDFLLTVAGSYAASPQWRQMQDQRHAQAMQQIQSNHRAAVQQMQSSHQDNMQWIQNSAQSHQARMDAIHAAGDARMQSWQAQQASSDVGHRNYMNAVNEQGAAVGRGGEGGDDGNFSHQRFVNYINGQETVIDPNGTAYQVEAGHERYFKHKRDDTYVGTDNYTELDDLRKRGLNPDDYDEVKVRR